MELSYLGAGCIRIATKPSSIIVDPYDNAAGLGNFTAKADVVLKTQASDVKVDEAKVFDGPGEYEVSGVMITGVASKLHVDSEAEGERGTIFAIHSDGLAVVVVGNIAPGLTKDELEALGHVDVLVVPVGGHGLTLDAQGAAQLVSLLEPAYVVPVHYDDGKTKYAMPQDTPEAFLKEMGSAHPESVAKLKISGKELPAEPTVVLLGG